MPWGVCSNHLKTQIRLTNHSDALSHPRSGTLGVYCSSSSPLGLFLIRAGHHTPRKLSSIIRYHGKHSILVSRQVDNRFRLLCVHLLSEQRENLNCPRYILLNISISAILIRHVLMLFGCLLHMQSGRVKWFVSFSLFRKALTSSIIV